MPTAREATFAVFAHFGVDALIGNPGPTELPMLRSMPGTDIAGIDFVALARSMGVAARPADAVAEIDAALEWSFAEFGLTLVEFLAD